jgi:hypothetical protein
VEKQVFMDRNENIDVQLVLTAFTAPRRLEHKALWFRTAKASRQASKRVTG